MTNKQGDVSMRWIMTLAAVVTIGFAAAPARAATLGCNLEPASSPANARIKATCVRANRLAVRLGNERQVSTVTHVPASACTAVNGNTFVWDCRFTIDLHAGSGFTAQTIRGVVRVRGNSRHPRALHVRLLGYR